MPRLPEAIDRHGTQAWRGFEFPILADCWLNMYALRALVVVRLTVSIGMARLHSGGVVDVCSRPRLQTRE